MLSISTVKELQISTPLYYSGIGSRYPNLQVLIAAVYLVRSGWLLRVDWLDIDICLFCEGPIIGRPRSSSPLLFERPT